MNVIKSQHLSSSLPETQSQPKSPSQRKQLLLIGLRSVISVSLIAWILWDTDLTDIVTAISVADMGLLLLAFSLYVWGWIFSANRWRLLLATQGIEAPISVLVKSYVVGTFFNNFLPSTIGGDTVRAYDSWRFGRSKSSAVTVIFVERLLGLLALMLFALMAMLLFRQPVEDIGFLYIWVCLGVVGMCLLLWLLFMPSPRIATMVSELGLPWGGKLANMMAAIAAFRGQKRALLGALGFSLLLQANVILQYYLIAKALMLPVSLFALCLVVPLVAVLMMVPVSINAIGIRENAFVFFLAMYGVTKPDALAFAWVAYGIVLLQGLFGGFVYALRK